MRIVMTGGTGDLGRLLVEPLTSAGHTLVNVDLRHLEDPRVDTRIGSVTDAALLAQACAGCDCMIHIAALHGIHEARESHDRSQFWDVNCTGTFRVLEACANGSVGKLIFISSTSVSDESSFYGLTKRVGEDLCRAYCHEQEIDTIVLRPRAFIPHWNKEVYSEFIEWVRWFWGGAVHIHDVAQAVCRSVRLIEAERVRDLPVLTLDAGYGYSADELARWDEAGRGSTFAARYPEFVDLATRWGLDTSAMPRILDISDSRRRIGYEPTYLLRNLLEELARQS